MIVQKAHEHDDHACRKSQAVQSDLALPQCLHGAKQQNDRAKYDDRAARLLSAQGRVRHVLLEIDGTKDRVNEGNVLHRKADQIQAAAVVNVCLINIIKTSREQVDHEQNEHHDGRREPEQMVADARTATSLDVKEKVEQNVPCVSDRNRQKDRQEHGHVIHHPRKGRVDRVKDVAEHIRREAEDRDHHQLLKGQARGGIHFVLQDNVDKCQNEQAEKELGQVRNRECKLGIVREYLHLLPPERLTSLTPRGQGASKLILF